MLAWLAAPIIAHTDMFTVFNVYSFGTFFKIIGAENLKKQEKCGKHLAAPRLFGWKSPIHSAWAEMAKYIFFKMAAMLNYKRASITSMGKHRQQ